MQCLSMLWSIMLLIREEDSFAYRCAFIQRGTWMLMRHFRLLTWNHAYTSLIPVEPLMPFWTVNLEGLSALVWHTFSLQLTYNSKQNYTKPITMRMRVKNQSHVSWRSVSRHFIRSLWEEFYSCTFFNNETLLTMGVQQKSTGCWHRSGMQRSTFPFALISGASYCIVFHSLYHLKCPVVHILTDLTRLQALRIPTICHDTKQYISKKKESFKIFFWVQSCTTEFKANSKTKKS